MTAGELVSLLLRAEPSYKIQLKQTDSTTGRVYFIEIGKLTVSINDKDRIVQVEIVNE